jgi:hypothetical protein
MVERAPNWQARGMMFFSPGRESTEVKSVHSPYVTLPAHAVIEKKRKEVFGKMW